MFVVKPKRLGTRGVAHFVMPLIIVVATGLVGTYLLVASHADSRTGSAMVLFSNNGQFDRARVHIHGKQQTKHVCGGTFGKSGNSNKIIAIPAPTASKPGFRVLPCTPTAGNVGYDVFFGKANGGGAITWQASSVPVDIDTDFCTFVHADGSTSKVSNASGNCSETAKHDQADAPKNHVAQIVPVAKQATTPPNPKFTVASYNVLGASHTDSDSADDAKAADSGPRMAKAVSVMEKSGFDIVGLQELQPGQRQDLLNDSNGVYDIYPSPANFNANFSQNSIIWKRSKFQLVNGGATGLAYYSGSTTSNAWVELRQKATGKEFVVFNAHFPVGSSYVQQRSQDARIQRAAAINELHNGLPVILVGDFNSAAKLRSRDANASRADLVYCIMTATGDIVHAQDLMQGNAGTCPRTDGSAIDHVYVSKQFKVTAYGHIVNASTNYASDHDPVVAKLMLNP